MSGEAEYQNYSEINLNAIKNTKLFQKFMQNKSGLISSGSSNNIVNPPRTSNHQQAQQQEVQVVRQKKWAKNNKNTNINTNKVVQIQQAQQLNEDELMKNNLKQENNIIPIKNRLEQQQISTQKIVDHSYQTVRNNKEFQNQQLQTQMNQMQASYGQRIQQNSLQITRTQNPPVQNKRKRNFNPNFQNSKNQPQLVQQSFKTQSKNFQTNTNEQQRPNPSYASNFDNKNVYEHLNQNNLNLYNTIRQQTFIQQEQKLSKTQFSPPRSQYPHNYAFNDQKMNISDLNTSSPSNAVPSVAITEAQYKQKYQILIKKYQQLKLEIKNENKNRKKEFTQWQHEIDMVKQKLFDVQSRQDSLLIENQRLKQKWQTQSLLKMKIQQENKQLGYKIKELQDQLSMRDNHMKQRVDQTNYWKAQSDGMRQDLHSLRLNFQKKNDQYNLLFGDYQIVKKERDNKDFLLDDLRRNIAFLVEENSAAKDQIFKLVTKLYQLEQENQILKNDIKRQSIDHSQLNNYMKDLQQQSRDRIQSTNIQRQHHERQRQYQIRNQRSIHNKNQTFVLKQTNQRNSLTEHDKPIGEKQTRRRGEFARERGQLTRNQKVQRDQRPFPTSQYSQNTHHLNISQQRQQNIPKKPQITNNKMGRMTEILQELEKIKDMKAMNGAIRRKKIELERQLQELESQ